MSTQFPTALDSFTNPTSSDTLASGQHSQLHANANDAIEALEAKVGVTNSAVPTSHDYRIAAVESGKANTSHTHTAADVTNFTSAVQALLAVLSVFGRTGAVTAQSGDYAAFYAALSHAHAIGDVTGLQAALDARLLLAFAAKTADYTLTSTDAVIDCDGTFTVTLPTAVGCAGRRYTIKNSGTGTVTVATTSSQTIDGLTTQPLAVQYAVLNVVSTGSSWIVV